MGKWKSIESAPKHCDCLVWTGKNLFVAFWVQNPITGDEAFAIADLEDGDRLLVRPTHWMPLPKPPKATP